MGQDSTGKHNGAGTHDGTMMSGKAPWQVLGPKMRLGLRSRPEEEWLPLNDAFGDAGRRREQIDLSNRLFDTEHAAVFSAQNDDPAANVEVLDMVRHHLATIHGMQPASLPPEMHPLEAAARLVPEDLLLLAPRQREDSAEAILDWVLVAGAMTFPAHWRLAEKMGRPLAGIHEPVPHYAEILERPMDRFFTNMQVGPISHRWNWTLVTSTDLFTPRRLHDNSIAPDEGLARLNVRMENQTLRKLPKSGQILFTIRTYVEPVLKWAATKDAMDDLAAMIAGLSDGMRDYRGAHRYEAALKQHIRTYQS